MLFWLITERIWFHSKVKEAKGTSPASVNLFLVERQGGFRLIAVLAQG
jgi:hypothetical protein